MQQKFMTGQPGARVSSILINCVRYSSAYDISIDTSPSFSLPLGPSATSFCVRGSWILSVAINGELPGRLMYGCKHKSNRCQPSSEDPHTVSMNSKSFYFTKVFIKAFGAYDIDSRKLKKNDIIDCCRLLSTTSSLLNSPY